MAIGSSPAPIAPTLTSRPTASAAPTTIASQREQEDRLGHEAGRAEHRGEGDRLRQAVEDDRRDAHRGQRDEGHRPRPAQEPGRERPPLDARRVDRVVLGLLVVVGGARRRDDAERREPVEGAEPDGERLALGAPLVAAELGHERERQQRVPDEHDRQRRGADHGHELEPHEEDEPRDRGPRADARGQLGERPASDADRAQQPGEDVVERRERVEPLPDREQQRGHERDPDPAEHPQEQRRDAASDDPPASACATIHSQPTRPIARRTRRRIAGTWTMPPVRDLGDAHVAGEDERERERDRGRGPHEVDGERQRALVDGRQAVGGGDRRPGEQGADAERGAGGAAERVQRRRPTPRASHRDRAARSRTRGSSRPGHRQAVRPRRRTR